MSKIQLQRSMKASKCRLQERTVLVQALQADIEAWQQHDVYFASNVGSVCRGMTTSQVAAFFDKGLLCVRAYEPSTGGCPFHLQKSLWSQTPAGCRVHPPK